jgi:putative alpha-1,2-mannosidase
MPARTSTRVAGLLTALIVPAGLITPAAAAAPGGDPVDAVNTFIGTKDDGNTFPGALAPFGMTQVSPISSHYAGYRYDDTAIRGFGHFFLSGAGCWEQGGLVSTLPTTGAVGPGAAFDTAKPETFDHKRYTSPYTHDGEIGKPGYYKVKLTGYGGVDAETTATTRTGVERYTFAKSGDANVFVNVGQANDKEPVSASSVRVAGDRTVEGLVESQAFCGGKPYKTWFTTTFDKPFKSFGTWSPTGGTPGSKESGGGAGLRGAWLTFDGGPVTATTAISHVDAEGARLNLAAERTRSFDDVRDAAQRAWRKELSSVDIQSASKDDRTVFYTSLYPQSQDGFHEGTSWQYQWLTQQDVPGLVERMGGKENVGKRLDDFFAYADMLKDPAKTVREEWVVGPYNYYNQFRYNPNNEPDLHSPWMYTLTGRPWKTSAVVRAAHTLFTNAPNGVTGNDDLGTMSAWYVFSALGMYPAVPGTGQFVLNAPRFAKAVVHLENGRDITIKADGADASKLQYVQGLQVGSRQSDRAYVGLEQLTRGTTVDFRLSEAPTPWATGPEGAPKSPCAG